MDPNTLCAEVSMNPKMFDILCCPVCQGDVVLSDYEIACVKCHLRYPIEDGIPVMLAERARKSS
ncbi:MAG: Trm112 family protein [Holophagaceae bacterium]